MTNLIMPMAGKSSRFPNLRPKWMLTHPSGKFMAIEAIRGLNLDDFEKIYFVCLSEQEERYQFLKGFHEELEDLKLLNKSQFIFLDKETRDQPETVYNAIKQGNITGPIFIKDSDNFFRAKCQEGNFVCFANLNNCGLIKPKNKSYIIIDPNGSISNIVEKQVISPYFCVGGYGFESAQVFLAAVDAINFDVERYISNTIFQQILKGSLFIGQEVSDYRDWGTLEDWDRFKRTYATLFVDIDGTLVENSSSHFPPYIGNTSAISANIQILQTLYQSGKFQIILTTSRPEKYRTMTIEQMKKLAMPFDHLIMGLFHGKRIIVNDYSRSNPYKSCDAINLKRNSDELKEILKESLGIEYDEL
ncbi:hypothetical protein [Geminocystis sp. GBBB08]|uniref:hypothetical protein n=1 Tax=Geminocystis sp. GBBB08 TaxID=2604140 RepID=UPI0027E34652|nr:hypothetical protein [Geminocystis sp. GBBB08]MBL1209497.1 hypothetical protein [Geminocystis sp. GBBB08]